MRVIPEGVTYALMLDALYARLTVVLLTAVAGAAVPAAFWTKEIVVVPAVPSVPAIRMIRRMFQVIEVTPSAELYGTSK